MKPLLTIFTPTYNRAYILHNLYESLKRQSSKNFEWVIVDDGSSDNTIDLINKWEVDTNFEIRYFKQENAGKMMAHNKGVENARGDLFVCVDSDDYVCDNFVELIEDEWKGCEKNDSLGGIIAYKKLLNYESKSYFPDNERMSMFDLFHSGFSGETTIILRTVVFKEYPFPKIDGEKFITEAYVYNQISQKYVVHLMREYLIICEYQTDGYTQNTLKLFKHYPGGWALYRKQCYILENGLKNDLKNMAEYICFSRQYGEKFWTILLKSPNMIMCLVCYPLGLYQDYKYRRIYYHNVN